MIDQLLIEELTENCGPIELLTEKKKSEFQKLKDNEQKLSSEERKVVADKKAEWSDKRSAVWKSVHPKTGKVTFITHTHRAYNTAPTVEGACARFHAFIKSTA